MRTHFAVALSTLLMVSQAMQLSAQTRHEGGSRPSPVRPSPVIPHEPMAREPGHAAPEVERRDEYGGQHHGQRVPAPRVDGHGLSFCRQRASRSDLAHP